MAITSALNASQANELFFGYCSEDNIKSAADLVNDFVRINVRESSFADKAMPYQKIGPEALTPQLNTDKPVKLIDIEPGSPGAVTVPLGAQPAQFYLRGNRAPVYFERLTTVKFTKDMTELMTYGYDIRQVVLDNSVLDIELEVDAKFLTAVDSIVGAEGSTVSETGVIQNRKITDAGGITRSSLAELTKILPSIASKLENSVILTNVLAAKDIAKFDRLAAGGDFSYEMLIDGFQKTKFLGAKWILTNKTELIPSTTGGTASHTFYILAEPSFLGKSYMLEELTTFVKKEAWRLEFFSYCLRGLTIANIGAVAKARIAIS